MYAGSSVFRVTPSGLLWQPLKRAKCSKKKIGKNNEFTMIKKCGELVVGVMTWFVELVELSMTRAKTVCPARSLPRPLKTSECSHISNNSSCHVSNSASLYFCGDFFFVRAWNPTVTYTTCTRKQEDTWGGRASGIIRTLWLSDSNSTTKKRGPVLGIQVKTTGCSTPFTNTCIVPCSRCTKTPTLSPTLQPLACECLSEIRLWSVRIKRVLEY